MALALDTRHPKDDEATCDEQEAEQAKYDAHQQDSTGNRPVIP